MTPDLSNQIAGHFAGDIPEKLGVAVSGGSDSVALLLGLHAWGGAALRVVSVDHGLRAEAADELAQVAELCAQLGLRHDVLRWDWDGTGNLMAAARDGRYGLMAGWAKDAELTDIALGHTRDDVAETFVMRLSRGAGLDGLAAMQDRMTRADIVFHRPLLSVSRADLRAGLRKAGVGWAEDPTNTDQTFERARVRKVMEALSLEAEHLARTAARLSEARSALGTFAMQVADDIVRLEDGDPMMTLAAWQAQPADIRRRLIVAMLRFVSGATFGARGADVQRLMAGLDAGQSATLQGCRVLLRKGEIIVTREAQAVANLRCAVDQLWDGRWRMIGPHGASHYEVAALGEAGLRQCPDRAETARPAACLISSPAIWEGTRLIAAPLAGSPNGWSAEALRGWPAFFELLR